MPRDSLTVEVLGEKFRFYFDSPGVLHITSRHDIMPEEAIEAYLTAAETSWDEEHQRYVSLGTTYGLYWARHAFDGAVILISCWRRSDSGESKAD